MPKLIMLVGLPASGKSTVSKILQNLHKANLHSSDELRIELFGDVNEQTKNPELFEMLYKRIIADMKNGINVVFDATNISYKKRMILLERINVECEKICYFMATPYEKCVDRDSKRVKSVGESVIKRMYLNFNIPQYFEGWDEIKIIWNFNKDDFSIEELFDGHEGLNSFDQKTPYHSLTVGKHCLKAFEYIDKLESVGGEKFLTLSDAAFFHDIGKPFVQLWNEEKQKCTYYQHQYVSAYNALFYMKAENVFDDNILKVCNLIQFHMHPYLELNKQSEKKFIELLGEEFIKDLSIIHEADLYAH